MRHPHKMLLVQMCINKPTPTSGYNHANGRGPRSLHEIKEQRAQQVSHRLQLFDGGDPQGHGAVLRLLLHPEVKLRNYRVKRWNQ